VHPEQKGIGGCQRQGEVRLVCRVEFGGVAAFVLERSPARTTIWTTLARFALAVTIVSGLVVGHDRVTWSAFFDVDIVVGFMRCSGRRQAMRSG
jgi:hypothetical protein